MQQCSPQNCWSCGPNCDTTTFAELGESKLSRRASPNTNDEGVHYLETRSAREGYESTGGFIRFEDKPASYAMGPLEGCVSVVVLSRAGLYISHHWEIYAYSPGLWETGHRELFQKLVLDALTIEDEDDMRALRFFVGENGPFEKQYNPVAFVLQRREIIGESNEYDRGYNDKNIQVAAHVEQLTGITPLIVKYYNKLDTLNDPSIGGKVQIDYGIDETVCGPQPSYSLWIDGNVVAFDVWDALSNQVSRDT